MTRTPELESLRLMPDDAIELSLSVLDVDRLRDALEAYEYWQLGDVLPRNNGHVFIPGDLAPGSDRYWDGVRVSRDQREAINEVIACRALSDRLRDAADAARMNARSDRP